MKKSASKKAALFCILTSVFCVLLFSGCGGGSGRGVTTVSSATGVSDLPAAPGAAQAGGETGSLSVQLIWQTPEGKFSAPAGVSTVRLSISASDMATVTRDFTASANAGTLTAILAGTSRVVSAKGLDSAGGCLYSGATSGVTVTAGQTTSVTVTMSTFCQKLNWTKYASNPVLSRGPSPYSGNVGRFTILFENGTYKLWTGMCCTDSIGYFTSADGISWTFQQKVLGTGTVISSPVNYPSVIKDGTTYKMWMSVHEATIAGYTRWSVGFATSPDGVSWTYQGIVLPRSAVDSGEFDITILAPKVIKDGSLYRMWYDGQAENTYALSIGYATSSDGINWTRQGQAIPHGFSGSTTASSISVEEVVKDGTGYRMWFSGSQFGTQVDADLFYEAISMDAVTWEYMGAIFGKGSNSCDDISVGGGSMTVILGSPNKMWFNELGTGYDWSIGYATAP